MAEAGINESLGYCGLYTRVCGCRLACCHGDEAIFGLWQARSVARFTFDRAMQQEKALEP